MALFSTVAFGHRGTPAPVGGILLAFVVPVALIGPLAGVFVGRSDLKRTMIASDLVAAALSAALVLASTPPQVYALVFALSPVSCFFSPDSGLPVAGAGLLRSHAQPRDLFCLPSVSGPR
jgi:MFS family permease